MRLNRAFRVSPTLVSSQSRSPLRPALDVTVAIPLVVVVSSTDMSARKQEAKTAPVETEYKNEGEVILLDTIHGLADVVMTWSDNSM